ncbi:sulfotransferase family protein [Octadecabacter sp. CECT 8868]|uniref:sulfotransferase family 2 domain-containing protein n=1 Tax=Octadecabacter algicola TaxID=2909342 RepID=UPI001F2709D9|nr:sulfotransferase family 2 domain-containing protein [Octadecabacter algicola]MCF2906664.1 sulfotransferase family protein [Octadecabacter algicola]
MPVALSVPHKLAFFSVPKAASTSVKMVLYQLDTGREWTEDADAVHPHFPTKPITVDDFASVPDGFWKFAILRDPVSRLLSSYGNRVMHHRDIAHAVHRKGGRLARLTLPLRHPGLRVMPSPDAYFCNLRRYQDLSYSIWHHTAPISVFIGSDLGFFDELYRISDIQKLEAELSARTAQTIVLPREQMAGRKIVFEDLSNKAQEAVLAHTAKDYQLLSEYFDPPR